MKKQLRLYIEGVTTSLINSLKNSFAQFAELKMVDVNILPYNPEEQIENENNSLNVFILTNSTTLDDFHAQVVQKRDLYSMCEINSSIQPIYDLLNDKDGDSGIMDFAMVGGQRQFFNSVHYDYLNERYYDFLHLGDVKREISEIEPHLRDAHVMRMSFNSLRYSDFSAKTDNNPSGFYAEDFIAIARYAGLSPKLDNIVLYDINMLKLENCLSCQELINQILWYMAEGYGYRMKEDHEDPEHAYFVFNLEEPDIQIEFIQSHKSLRWWYRFEDSEGSTHTFSCNFTDFESMQNKLVSPRIKSSILRYL